MPQNRVGTRRLTAWTDAAGVFLFAGLVAVDLVTATSIARGLPMLELLVVGAAVFIVARLSGKVDKSLAPGVVVLWAIFLVVQFPRSIVSYAPLGAPFGYANAKGAFFALVVVAALTVLVRGPRALRPVAAAVAGGAAVVPFVSHSYAAALLALAVPLTVLLVGGIVNWRAAVVVCAALFAVAVGLTIYVAASHDDSESSAVESEVTAVLTPTRVTLWSEAFDLMMRHPFQGVGPGHFRTESPTALSNDDFHWAHNGFLQQGAEQGVLGLALAIGIFIWGFARLALRPSAVSALAAAAMAILGIHACIDYILHFAILPVAVAALVGSASAARPVIEDLTYDDPVDELVENVYAWS